MNNLCVSDAQDDENMNGVGDACDYGPDSDKDGIVDQADNCPTDFNPSQADHDSDLWGDACDDDDDNDGIPDTTDTCVFAPNTQQSDIRGQY